METINKVLKNKEKIEKALRATEREGIEDLIAWLDTTDFYVAPASTMFHSNCEGGLASHCLKVLKVFNDNCKRHTTTITLSDSSIIIIALLHDLCKVNLYKKVMKPAKDDKLAKDWVLIPGYEYVDEFPMGHGEKSVDIIRDFIDLSVEEKLCIRWHMGPYEGETKWREFGKAKELYPSVSLFNVSDMIASDLYEKTITREELIRQALIKGDFAYK